MCIRDRSSTTATRSHIFRALRRWATTMTVLPLQRFWMALSISIWFSGSEALVASSKTVSYTHLLTTPGMEGEKLLHRGVQHEAHILPQVGHQLGGQGLAALRRDLRTVQEHPAAGDRCLLYTSL